MTPTFDLCAFCASAASPPLPMKGFAIKASNPILVRCSTATSLVFSMSFNLMSAIDCRPYECRSLFICDISDADSGRIMWKFILTAQMCCSTTRMVFAANSGRLRLFAGGLRPSTIGLFLALSALAILFRNGLVIGLYRLVVHCKPHHLELYLTLLLRAVRYYVS